MEFKVFYQMIAISVRILRRVIGLYHPCHPLPTDRPTESSDAEERHSSLVFSNGLKSSTNERILNFFNCETASARMSMAKINAIIVQIKT